MQAPAKRNAFMDWLFGAPLTGDDLARHLATRPPRWVRDTEFCLWLRSLFCCQQCIWVCWTDFHLLDIGWRESARSSKYSVLR